MPTVLASTYKTLYEGLNYRMRTAFHGKFASHCRPTSIVFLLTELCNARCVHCYLWKNRGKEDSPTVEQWKTVLSDLRSWLGPVHVVFSGGEALLMPWAPEVVGHAARIGLFVEHLTHGYWEDQSRIEKLALANPWRITISFDGVGETHTKVRGRPQFFEKTLKSIRTLQHLRKERNLGYAIRLKTVIMSHNLDNVCEVARFAGQEGLEIFYQPIEQIYNTPEDARWFEHSDNWPKNTERATAVVQELIRLKREGFPVANSFEQLEAMIPYFRDPDSMRVAVQSHQAHERRALCAALTTLQLQANGDVTVCFGKGQPVGNVKTAPIREIWEKRPHWWESGCCMETRLSEHEKETLAVLVNS